jgi:hydrogenase expression/formation protein HypE
MNPASSNPLDVACPLPFAGYERVVLGHGSGGRLSRELLEQVLLPALGLWGREPIEDQAVLAPITGRPVLTTDSFVVRPLFFPGGDIGRLSVFGTVNDLAVGGAVPRDLALSFILEEGLPLETLVSIARSVARACAEARVQLVTGDTKVVERGKAEGLYITTSGVGVLRAGVELSVKRARPGDVVIVSGHLGDHGIAVMVEREGIEIEGELRSDAAPLTGLVQSMLEVEPGIRCLRDPTRGGLASAVNEIASASRVAIQLDESAIPVRPAVRGVCELLGLDPLYVACEGRLVAIAPASGAERLVTSMRAHPLGRDAAIIGEVHAAPAGRVTQRTQIGGERLVLMLAGEQLPRIC